MIKPNPTNLNLFEESSDGPVECLGLIFENDESRRAYFLERLREKLQDPNFRAAEGFPVSDDQDNLVASILALSNPPYYTACPNPFLSKAIEHWQSRQAQSYKAPEMSRDAAPGSPSTIHHLQPYHREPFAADVSEGKSDPIYNAHSYHTKVPHKAIMRYILHYTDPGDIVFDGFCGTGMTGVAAQLCGDRAAVQSLGYTVQGDGAILDEYGRPFSKLGVRQAILNDLSPAATFIAYNYNTPVNVAVFECEARRLLDAFETRYGWMYETKHTDGQTVGRINYVVWSDVFICPHCQGEIVFWTEFVRGGQVKKESPCPHCGAMVTKQSLDRATVTKFDLVLNEAVAKAKRVPVAINYTVGKSRFEKDPDQDDLNLLSRIESEAIPDWYPSARIDRDIDLWYERDYRSLGIYSVDAFFHRRSLIMISFFRREIMKADGRLRGFLWFWFQSVLMGFSLLNRYLENAFSQVNRILSGTLYVGSMLSEVSPWYALEGKIKRMSVFNVIRHTSTLISTSSTTTLDLPSNSLDYIFADPPFGSNIIYSDLSILWEAWLGLATNTDKEAVVHRRKKARAFKLRDYLDLMTACFTEMQRVLKPGRWLTVEFHNSQNSVWVAIQEALERAGFVIADVRTLDKQQGSFKQVTAANAVQQDLIISAYKPNEGLEERFRLEPSTEESAWAFTRTHLRQLPVFVSKAEQAQILAERQNYVLFDRMVAFHIRRGAAVPISAADFYAGLAQRFPERDGMYFLPEQVVEYDKKRLLSSQVQQLTLLVSDEASSIQWLRQQLDKKPQTYSDIFPQFAREMHILNKHEKMPELSDLLAQNFLCYDGEGDVPSQVHTYLSTNFKDLRSLPKDHPSLRAKAKNRWYVPDPNKAADLERLRERALLKEFEEYRQSKQRKLKIFRMEAVRAGFRKAWRDKKYAIIIEIAKKIPNSVLEEDSKLLMWYDQALTRAGNTH